MLLHGQPGSAADWQQLAGRLPGPLDVVALDRPGYGTSQQPAGGFGYGARAVLAFGAAWSVAMTLAVLTVPAIRHQSWPDPRQVTAPNLTPAAPDPCDAKPARPA